VSPKTDEAVEERPRFASSDEALENVTKVATIRAGVVEQLAHLDGRLEEAIADAVAAGATKTEAKAAAKGADR